MVGLAIALCAVLPLSAAEPLRELGANDEVYTLRSGPCTELLGEWACGTEAAILALEVRYPDGTRQIEAVPGSEGIISWGGASMLVDDASGSVFIAWENRLNGLFSDLYLARYRGELGWAESIDLSTALYVDKRAPRLAATHSTYSRPGPEGPVEHDRTVLHLLWWEDSGAGARAVYSPVVFLDGEYVGENPRIVLDDLGEGTVASVRPPPGFFRKTWMESGADVQSLAAAVSDLDTERLFTLRIRALPVELGLVADKARADIIEIGARYFPHDLAGLADKARADIIEIGARLETGFKSHLADATAALIAPWDPAEGDLAALAEKARADIIEIGAKADANGMVVEESAPLSRSVLEIPADSGTQLVEVAVLTVRPVPPAGRWAQVLIAPSGQDVLVAWPSSEGQSVSYVINEADGWSEVRPVAVDEELDEAAAFELLHRRIRRR